MSTYPASSAALLPHRTAAGVVGTAAVLSFAGALVLVWRGNEIAATWFYDAAWWSYIFFVDALVYRRRGSSLLWSSPRAFALLSVWSAAFWLFFEVVNFRLQNWYYVGVPREEPTRTIGIFVSFATVLPGIFETSDLLSTWRWFDRLRCTPWRISSRARAGLFALGLGFLLLPLCFPRYAFPLVWGAVALMSEAWLLERASGGLLRELCAGRIGTIVRWLAAGLVCGILWETWNSFATAHWIYTVPFFEDSKLFEMPIAGFLGFPPFALECYSFARVLVALRVVPDWESPRDSGAHASHSEQRQWLGLLAAFAFSVPAVLGVNAFTVRATRPLVDEIPGVPADFVATCADAGIRSTQALLAASERDSQPPFDRVDPERRREILDMARLMQVRGLGARGARALSAAGIRTVHELAWSDPNELYGRLTRDQSASSPSLTPAEVRIWVRGARLDH